MLKKLIAENLYKWEKESLAPPTQISITPTNLCNLKCRSCWKRDEAVDSILHKKPAEIPGEKLLSVIAEAKELGVKCVELTGGGEPLVRKAVTAQLIKEIKNRSMIGWLTTNGTLFSPEIVQLIVESEWDKLTVSLDAPDAKTNDFLRPPAGSFEKILNTLNLFKERKKLFNKDLPVITFNVVVSKYNINKISEIICLASQYGAQGVTFEPVKVLANECKELLVDFEKEYDRIVKELEKTQVVASKRNIFTNIDSLIRVPELIKYSGKLLKSMPINALNDGESRLLEVSCIEPWFHIYLEADGNVRPCCVNPGFGENIYNKSLKDIWFGEKFFSFRNAIISKNYPLSCNQCNANLICFSREIQEALKEKLFINEYPVVRKELKVSQKKQRLRMLITDTAPLYPPLWGGPKRIWNLYSNFSQDLFSITYVGVKADLKDGRKYRFNKICDNFREISCVFPPHYYFWHAFEKLIFKNTSLDLFPYLLMRTDWQFKYVLNSQNADVIICSHPWSSLCVRKNSNQFFIYDAHNCEYLLMRQILGERILKDFVLRQVKRIEGDACKKSDLILVCSENEKKDFMDLYGINENKIYIVPNGTVIKPLHILEEKRAAKEKLGITGCKIVVFIGAYYKPNIEAAEFIVNNLASTLKEYIFLITGSVKDAFRDRVLPGNVVFSGMVSEERLDLILRASDIAINPMFNGSGVNIKMLDYLGYGLPVVTSPCGNRGLKTEHMKNIFLASIDEFSGSVRTVMTDTLLYNRLKFEGYQFVREGYDWKAISRNLEKIILDIISK